MVNYQNNLNVLQFDLVYTVARLWSDKMLTKVKCPTCLTVNHVNLEKRVYKPKYCTNCKSPIANLSPKLRVLSVFQRRKKERKQQTRQRFLDRIAIILWSQFKRKPTNQEIEAIAKKGYVNEFDWEKD